MSTKSAVFESSTRGQMEHTEAIVPLISQNKEGSSFFIGTAFYISNVGILMTAKHNLFNKQDKLFDNLSVIHFTENNSYIVRPILKITYSNDYDLAFLLPSAILDKNKNIVPSPSLILTKKSPIIGEQLATYGYPNSRLEENIGNFNGDFFLGQCNEFHTEGFGLLKNPCFQTTIQIKSGASGGPVFDEKGQVFAICSTGYDLSDDGDNISFVTPIFPAFNIQLEDAEGNAFTIWQLIERKIISFHDDST